MLIIVGCGIVESLLHFLLTANGHYATTDWELVDVAPGNPKKLDGETRKIDAHIDRQMGSPQPKQMTFAAMIRKSESKKVLGSDGTVYAKLRRLRPLRNKVHLKEIGDFNDTDWHSFNWSDACSMAQGLHAKFTSNVFRPSAAQRGYFEYLERYGDL